MQRLAWAPKALASSTPTDWCYWRQRISYPPGRAESRFEKTGPVGALDDLQVDLAAGGTQPILEFGALVPAVGIKLQQEGIEAEQRPHQQHAAVAVLDVGGVEDGLLQQPLGVDQDVPLLAFDLLARVVARRVDEGPPFSALLTLWLSMIAAVGLASRPTCSRHNT